MKSHVELYEALKPYVGEKGARLIADVVPPAGDVAKKADVLVVRADLEALRADVIDRIGRLESRVFRAALFFFLPMWVSVWAALAVMLFRL